jgi:hypothetical protein
MKTITALSLCLGLATSTAFAQQTPSTSQPFRTGVEAVEIDVRALDDKGQPIADLTAADFEVFGTASGRMFAYSPQSVFLGYRGQLPRPLSSPTRNRTASRSTDACMSLYSTTCTPIRFARRA